MRQRWLRLLPVMLTTFIIAFMDRTNISSAIPTMGGHAPRRARAIRQNCIKLGCCL